MTTTPCGCDFALSHPTEHDVVLGIEDMDPVTVATYIAQVIGDDEIDQRVFPFRDDEPVTEKFMLQGDPSDIRKFVGQHNWKNPAAMWDLACAVEFAMTWAWEGRRAREGTRVVAVA